MPTLHLLLQIPPPPARSGLFATFLSSGPMALFVLGLLLALSLACWTIMLWKVLALRRAENQGRRFLEVFRGSRRFGEVQAASGKLAASPLVGLFQAGYAELDHQIKAARELEAESSARYRIKSLEAVERSLKRAEGVELRSLARGTQLLATTASASPFIGLFGTVWGIMVAFEQIGLQGTTSLVAVAPGIAEALVNTAAGLAAAIPALIGYNYFSGRIQRIRGELDDFVLEFMNLAERNFT
ncbi:MAG TPA: MotA/TolQ/ExbB proton channel family protein [Thermoanaerobaculia bacterium]|nr:MotA/TolQ/ExbB proton channel family protein [Thermoanaerobaculia bacterium]MDI9632239.1 MotA/TolQ/ExbB proton channel family protein [Acidobacteriota bacterium]OQC34560.1 MAG: Biopolymer transport protein ExbB [Acidobacteria bacterium ADurb.Bin051]MBP7814115.1 MotA/TolQ/ExbB proton channel family protein [Thermoanaerobaculia bacterium]MBP8844717.1 MotA/TolQ/ExbB proton channel family protein [Thermoanaerobaculia bacterium]